MENELSPNAAREVLDSLTQGSSIEGVDTPLALRLIPLAHELSRSELIPRLIDHAMNVAKDEEERTWVRFEAMKLNQASMEAFDQLLDDVNRSELGLRLNAAVHHHVALMHNARGDGELAMTLANRALRLREDLDDPIGLSFAYALLMTIAKQQHDFDTAIAYGTQRLEILQRSQDQTSVMETLADLAHCQATIGAMDSATDLFNQSLEIAEQIEDLSGQLVARWGLADIAEINEDYESAMLVLTDYVHVCITQGSSVPIPVKSRIQALTNLQQPGHSG